MSLVKDQMYQILSICAIVAFFIPITIVILRKLWREQALLLFACYWLLCGIINIVDILPYMGKRQLEIIGVLYNMIDGPFVFIIIYFTTFSRSIKKFVAIIVPLLVATEIGSLVANGVRYEALTYVLGAGILLALVIVTWSIGWYLQKVEYSYHEKSMLFIYAALLFSNGTFSVIYIFDYFINNAGSKDNFLVYYISCVVAMSIACCGFFVKPSSAEGHIEEEMPSSIRSPHFRF